MCCFACCWRVLVVCGGFHAHLPFRMSVRTKKLVKVVPDSESDDEEEKGWGPEKFFGVCDFL